MAIRKKAAARGRSMKELIPKAAPKAFGKRGFAEGKLLLDWPVIAGEHIAQHSVPQKLARNRHGGGAVLHVDVNPAFALDLQQMEPLVLEKIARHAGYRAVERIVLHQTPHIRPAEAPLILPEPSDLQQQSAALETAQVQDEDLRGALTRLGARILQREESLANSKDGT